jgi:hypothetical protein
MVSRDRQRVCRGGVVPVQSTSSDYNARSARKAARARWAKVKKG